MAALLTSDRPTHPQPLTDHRLPAVPSQRTRPGTGPMAVPMPPITAAVPASMCRTISLSTGDRPRRRPAVVAAVLTTVLALGVAGASTAVTLREEAHRAAVVRENVALAVAAAAADADLAHRVDVAQVLAARTARAEDMASRGAAVTRATPAVEAARAALAAAPQASPESRAALQAAIDAAARLAVADPLPFVESMDAAAAALVAPQQAVAQSQTAWRVAEDARIAAEAAARQARAAAAAAEQTRAPQPASRSTASTARAKARASGAPSAPAAASSPAPAPAASGVPEFSAGALGEAINAHRTANGLPAVSVSRSGALFAHAAAMAQAGSIWHGGSDKIVGFVKPASASSLVRAWAGSPAHNAWMLRGGISSMRVGAAQLDGRLYGAVDFG